jgi:hypothetical protein
MVAVYQEVGSTAGWSREVYHNTCCVYISVYNMLCMEYLFLLLVLSYMGYREQFTS